jgi:hypothetical protein
MKNTMKAAALPTLADLEREVVAVNGHQKS